MLSVKYYIISPQQAYNIFLALYCLNCSTFNVSQVPMCVKKTQLKIKNLKFIMCFSFNKVSPVQLIYHESRYTKVKTIDVTYMYPADMNFDPNYSAVMKCQDNFKFKITNYNTLFPKYIVNLLNSVYSFLLH